MSLTSFKEIHASWRGLMLAVLAVAVQGCGIGKISYVGVSDESVPNLSVACGMQASSQGCQLDQPVRAMIGGVGNCTLLRIHWGDGQTSEIASRDLGNYPTNAKYVFESHTYTGWPGLKRVTVEGITNCAGTATTEFMLVNAATGRAVNTPIQFHQPVATTCTPVPNKPALRPGTIVSIMANPSLPPTNYGCPFGGCVFGADGKPGSTAAAPFPFPGFREYSMVLRVGPDVFQGGLSAASFTTVRPGALEVCVNDAMLSDNNGAWGVFITVDERAAP